MRDSPSILFCKNDRPQGITYENWTISWWKWLVGIPRLTNPAMDLTGENANLNQPNRRVFFFYQARESIQSIPWRTISNPFWNHVIDAHNKLALYLGGRWQYRR